MGRQRVRGEFGSSVITLMNIADDMYYHITQYFDGLDLIQLAATSKEMGGRVEENLALFPGGHFTGGEEATHASWKHKIKRWWCSETFRCVVCLENDCPPLPPWIHLNLCHGKFMVIDKERDKTYCRSSETQNNKCFGLEKLCKTAILCQQS